MNSQFASICDQYLRKNWKNRNDPKIRPVVRDTIADLREYLGMKPKA